MAPSQPQEHNDNKSKNDGENNNGDNIYGKSADATQSSSAEAQTPEHCDQHRPYTQHRTYHRSFQPDLQYLLAYRP
jgi:hypothetical protein